MELKDVILSTLAEMEDIKPQKDKEDDIKQTNEIKLKISKDTPRETSNEPINVNEEEQSFGSEALFLKSMRERLLVLFEGFQAPNNTNIEAKVDMTLNFLEYVLVMIDSRIEEIERGKHK